ncbi:MAG TPA: AsmA-like C-terminal region-containing protein [Bacteroidia bacterium]|nr:AsmA-like C-terminal region-containing protein [Bacteroidia bacterium]
MSENAEIPAVPEVRRPLWKKILRFTLWTGGIFVFLILTLSVLTWIFRDDIKKYVFAEACSRVKPEIVVQPSDIDVYIISSFPDVTVQLNNVAAIDTAHHVKNDTLLKAGRIELAFNMLDLFHHNYTIRNITIENGALNLWDDAKGNDNYHFLKEDTAKTTDTSHVDFALEKVQLKNMACSYRDKKSGDYYSVTFTDIFFKGKFTEKNFGFSSDADFLVNKLLYGKNSFFEGDRGNFSVDMDIDRTTNTYSIRKTNIAIEKLSLGVTGSVTETGKKYATDLTVKGEQVELTSVLSLLPVSYHKNIADFESTGEFFVDGTVKGIYSDSSLPVIDSKFGIRNGGTLKRRSGKGELHDISLNGTFTNQKGKDGLVISSFKASGAKSIFSGSFSVLGFAQPKYDAKLSGRIDLGELYDILQPDTLESASGTVNISLEGSGKPSKAGKFTIADFRKFRTQGNMGLANVAVKMKGAKSPVDSINGNLSFDGNNVGISHFTARSEKSDIVIDGTVRNLLGFLFTKKEVLDVSGKFSSNNLDLNAILAENSGETGTTDTTYHLVLPERLKLNLDAAVKKIAFRLFEAENVAGKVSLSGQRLIADPLSLNTMGGSISGSGMIDGTMEDSLLMTCNANISQVDITKLFYEMENFGQGPDDEVITDKNVKGRLTSTVNFASLWGNDLSVNEKKIFTDADVTIEQGELIDFKPLSVLSRFIKLDDLMDVRFKNLHNTITIRNRVISMPKMEISSSAMNVTMSGTHDFDNNVDYHFIVDLDELRANKVKKSKPQNSDFGQEIDDGGHRYRLFIIMKGPIDDPDVKYDSKGFFQQKKEELKQEKQNLRQLLHDEWGIFRDDSAGSTDPKKKGDRKTDDGAGKFILQQSDKPAKTKKKPKDQDLDDSGDY